MKYVVYAKVMFVETTAKHGLALLLLAQLLSVGKNVCNMTRLLVFSAKYDLEDSFDYEGMMYGHKEFKKVCDRLADLVKGKLSDFLLLSNEGCIRCNKCTYPYEPCRFPDKLFPSVEGFGIMVSSLHPYHFYYISNFFITYFGLLLFKKLDI